MKTDSEDVKREVKINKLNNLLGLLDYS